MTVQQCSIHAVTPFGCRGHAQALKAAADEWQVRHGVERILTCGFLSGAQPVVDLYELKVGAFYSNEAISSVAHCCVSTQP